jgi:hypothetical protein
MSDYKKILEQALNRANKQNINENATPLIYPEDINERMHPSLEQDLVDRTHSLGNHPIFPDSDDNSFEQKLIADRFSEVVKRYKRAHDTDNIDHMTLATNVAPMLMDTMQIESKHKKELEKLAIEMIREEYDMDDDVVEIHAELVSEITIEGTKKNPKPVTMEMEFENIEDIGNAKEEVQKRRFLNAMIQGAAKKCNHMFHMVDDKLMHMDPKLANRYAQVMSAADYMYYAVPNMDDGLQGGMVHVQFPTKENPKTIITAQAIVFPVLIHELVKGVMEILAAHGLPKDKTIGEYVINKADYLSAEPWDMRLGCGLFERFTSLIEPDDFKLKHHIFAELAALPVKEFNVKMKEIMAGTKEGKKIINNIVSDVKKDIREDDYNESMKKYEDDSDGFSWDDLQSLL